MRNQLIKPHPVPSSKISSISKYAGEVYTFFELFLSSQFDLYYFNRKKYYCPYFPIVQSSGMGKTRLMFELTRNTDKFKTAYICIRKLNGHGYPRRMDIFSDLICSLEGDKEWFLFLIALLEEFTKKDSYNVMDPENDSNFGGKTKGRYQKLFKDFISPSFSLRTDEDITECILNDRCFHENFASIKKNIGKQENIVLAIDEITTIFKDEDKSSFLSFRRALLAISCWLEIYDLKIMGIVLDTNSAVTNLAPPQRLDKSKRVRLSGECLLHPFVSLANFGVLRFENILSTNSLYQSHLKSFKKYPPENSFQIPLNVLGMIECGRPMFTQSVIDIYQSFFHLSMEKVENEALSFAIDKISLETGDKIAKSCSLLCCRTGIMVSNHELSEKLVKSLLATCSYIDDNRAVIFSSYMTEPLLAEASAFVMHEEFSSHITNFCSVFLNSFSQDEGNVGEYIVSILLLRAIDSAILKAYKGSFNLHAPRFLFCRPITVKSLLGEITNYSVLQKVYFDDSFLSGLVSVNNVSPANEFFSKEYISNMRSFASIVWGMKDQPGFDFAIPVTLTSGICSSILVQVKNNWLMKKGTYKKALDSAKNVIDNIIPNGISTLIIIINTGPYYEDIPKINSITDSNSIKHVVLFLSPQRESSDSSSTLEDNLSFFPSCADKSKKELLSLCIKCENKIEKSIGPVYEVMRSKLPKDTKIFETMNDSWLKKSFFHSQS